MWKTEHTTSFTQNICPEDVKEERKKELWGYRSQSVKKGTHIPPHSSWENTGKRYVKYCPI